MRSKIKILSSILTFAILLSSVSPSFGLIDEGMFTPDQIVNLNLRQKGLKIAPNQIYNPNGVDISDAVVRLSIGCTGEFVSPNGLILTNHHCGFDALVSASTPQNDYAERGFRAASPKDELIAKDYSIFITNRVENVTARVRKGTENLTGDAFDQAIKTNIETLQAEEQAKVAGGGSMIRIQALNSGFYYFLYETKQIKDIRVVYAPTRDIGNFGGDPDNFEWTRHTGDFTFLRAYVAPDGASAEYSPNNVPYKPKKFLTISLNGVKENDFVFVLGYPGGTTRYRESQSIDYAEQVQSPFIAEYYRAYSRAVKMAAEEASEEKRIKLEGEIPNIENVAKLFEGASVAFNRSGILDARRGDEAKFIEWVNANPARRAKYGEVLNNLRSVSERFYTTARRDRVLRTFPNAVNTPVFNQLYNAVLSVQQGKVLTNDERMQKLNDVQTALKDREPVLEREVLKFFLKAIADLPENQKFQAAESLFTRFQGRERRAAEETFAESIAESKDFDTADEILALYSMSFKDLRKKYPNIVDFITALAQARNDYAARANSFNSEIDRLRLLYQQGMAEMKGKTLYPDANSTLRFTYGYVKGYKPREAVTYSPFTTLKGVLEKDTGEFPFDVPEKLKQLQKTKNFGRYGVGGSVPVNFLATTDIIGGNSGSPVMNAYGEQVGIVFDSNFEGLGNDIFYSSDYGRTIAVDIRYVLFLAEKLDNMSWIINEMSIKGAAKRVKT